MNFCVKFPNYWYFNSLGLKNPCHIHISYFFRSYNNNRHFNLNVVARQFVNAKRGANGVKIVSLEKEKKI